MTSQLRQPADGMEIQPSNYDSEDVQNRNFNFNLNGGFTLCNEEMMPVEIDTTIQKDAQRFLRGSSKKLDRTLHMKAMATSRSLENCDKNSLHNKPTPNYIIWAESLEGLLNDPTGVKLFRSYLQKVECNPELLEILFACRGLTNKDEKDLPKIIKIIYKRLIKKVTCLKAESKQKIVNKIKSNTNLDVYIFKEIEAEIEDTFKKTTYPNFLNSDQYLDYFQNHNGAESHGASEGASTTSSPLSPEEPVEDQRTLLSTLPEDKELEIAMPPSTCARYSLTEESLNNRNWFMEKYQSNSSKRPSTYSSYHSKYAPFLPGSAKDSERQSVSSEALTDSLQSIPDSLGNEFIPKKIHKKMVVNKNDAIQTIPRQKFPDKKLNNLAETTPGAFAQLVIDKLSEVVRQKETDIRFKEALDQLEDKPPQAMNPKPGLGKQPIAQILNEILHEKTIAEDDQSILDRHMQRVWTDQTPPLRTPLRATSPPLPKNNPTEPYNLQHRDIHFIRHIHHYEDRTEEFPEMTCTSHNQEKNNNGYGHMSDNYAYNSGVWNAETQSTKKPLPPKYKLPENFPTYNYPQEVVKRCESSAVSKAKAFKSNIKELFREKPVNKFQPSLPLKEEESVRKRRSSNSQSEEFTIIGYKFPGDSVPYRVKCPGKNITLKQFKAVINRKGEFRYFFKKQSNEFENEGVIKIEIQDDHDIVPTFEGKVYAEIQHID